MESNLIANVGYAQRETFFVGTVLRGSPAETRLRIVKKKSYFAAARSYRLVTVCVIYSRRLLSLRKYVFILFVMMHVFLSELSNQ